MRIVSNVTITYHVEIDNLKWVELTPRMPEGDVIDFYKEAVQKEAIRICASVNNTTQEEPYKDTFTLGEWVVGGLIYVGPTGEDDTYDEDIRILATVDILVYQHE